MSALYIKQINEYVKQFINDHKGSKTIASEWRSKENQDAFKAIIKTKVTKSKSTYIYFCQIVRARNKELDVSDKSRIQNSSILSECGRLWQLHKDTDHEDVVKARELSDDDKERHSVESGKKRSDKNKIKKAKTAFMLYSMKQRVAFAKEGVKGKDIMSKIGETWAALKKSKKKKDVEELKSLTEQANEDKIRYKDEKDGEKEAEEEGEEEGEDEDEEEGNEEGDGEDDDEEEEEDEE
jgi:HMG (high mobility group) box